MERNKHLKADNLRSEISKLADYIKILDVNKDSVPVLRINIICASEILLDANYSAISKEIVLFVKRQLEARLDELEKEYEEL